jgi:hypothetical protein
MDKVTYGGRTFIPICTKCIAILSTGRQHVKKTEPFIATRYSTLWAPSCHGTSIDRESETGQLNEECKVAGEKNRNRKELIRERFIAETNAER